MHLLRVLFLGPVGAGKSHLARACAARTGGVVLPFAKDVYILAQAVLNRPVDKSQPGDRELLKAIGTAWGREGNLTDVALRERLDELWRGPAGYPDIWVDSFIRNVNDIDPYTSIFNDDTRFPNELTRAIAELDFIPIFVSCSSQTRLTRLRDRREPEPEAVQAHKSEHMNALLSEYVLAEPLLPVIWNDASVSAPAVPWVIAADQFYNEVTDPEAIIGWCKKHLRLPEVRNLIEGDRCNATSMC